MQIDISRFRETFLEEAAEHLANLESGFLRLESTPGDEELLNAIFRAAHSIKGGAGTFGFDAVAHFTHGLETVLDRLRAGELPVSPALVAVLLRSADILRGLLAAGAGAGPEPKETGEVLKALEACLEGKEQVRAGETAAATAPSCEAEYEVFFKPSPDLFRQGMDPLLVLRDLASLGTVTKTDLDLSAVPPLAEMDPETAYLAWTVRLRTTAAAAAIRDVFLFVEDGSEVKVTALSIGPEPSGRQAPLERRVGGDRRASVRTADGASIRVATEKVDQLIDLVGELAISQAMLVQALDGFSMATLPRVLAAAADLQRYTRELQDRVMAVRMVPLATVFNRFPRVAHDLAELFGKRVTLDVTGGETELDKAVVERLADPLTHLVRNAIDHGLEPGAERLAAGKAESGLVSLRAYHAGGAVVVEVADDGRGLDFNRVKAKARTLGWLGEEADASEEQLAAFLFQPGFSTAATVTDVSGRGVGMDVVKRNVEGLGGKVAVSTEAGRGTCFRITLPLTLAILDGQLLGIGTQVFVMPLVAIVESLRPSSKDVHRVLGQGEVVRVRGEALPLLRLHALLGIPGAETDPTKAIVVIAERDGRRYGLLVDHLLAQQQVVIKNLEANYRKVDGVSAATILGDGRVALILDVTGLTRLAAARLD